MFINGRSPFTPDSCLLFFCYNKTRFSLHAECVMNCSHCTTELPIGVSSCPLCESQIIGNKPIFPPVPLDQQPQGELTRRIGCSCILGAMLMVAVLAGVALFMLDKEEPLPEKPHEEIKVGADSNLYGRTIQDEEFEWASLRGKYVLVKFTATTCPACQMIIPGMLDTYEKYHDQGLEIVSVYVGEREPNAVETVKNHIERKKLPWIIISESLSVKAGHPPQEEFYGIPWLPAMVLVDKEGKVIAVNSSWEPLRRELKKIFEE